MNTESKMFFVLLSFLSFFFCSSGMETYQQNSLGREKVKDLLEHESIYGGKREKRNKNERCTLASDNSMRGTCLSRADCEAKGGNADGNCASGFGVCCMFSFTGCNGNVNHNCTYIQNTGFPNADMTEDETCTYNLNRICPGRCNSDGSGDVLRVTSPHSMNSVAFPPGICGDNNGQHMYLETTRSGDVAGQISIIKGTDASTTRRWKIKVKYILCHSELRAPNGCAQYFTGRSGTVKSYNFDGGQILRAQQYKLCIRQEEGFCQYQLAETTGISIDAFGITGPDGVAKTKNCGKRAYLIIPSEHEDITNEGVVSATTDFRCGTVFSATSAGTTPSVVTSSRITPFEIGFRTEDEAGPGADARYGGKTGFSLDYTQIPC